MRIQTRFTAIAAAVTLLASGATWAASPAPAAPAAPAVRPGLAARAAVTGRLVPAGVPRQPAECCGATGADVPKVGGDLGDQDYSSLDQITAGNVTSLAGAWLDHLPGGPVAARQESTPVAVGGVLYLQTSDGDVFAVNGATGDVIWTYSSGEQGKERGVAVGAGRVYAALPHERVVALNQTTGALVWQAKVGTAGQDTAANDSSTPWVLYYRGLVLTGTENGGGAGMRGHLYALHASTGKRAWAFAGTAGPGQPGHSSWKGGSWRLGGGDVWMAPAVDPQLGLIYLTVANPQPRTAGAARKGNDLYTNSLVALHWSTGKPAWWFQSVHHDLWDYDNTMSPVIADVRVKGKVRKVVVYGSKTAWLYYLDAKTGKPVLPVREVKVRQLASQDTARTQPIPQGNPLEPTCPEAGTPTRPIPDYLSGCEFTPYLHAAVLVDPAGSGGANWALMSFDQRTGLIYVPAALQADAYTDGKPYGQPTFWAPEGELTAGVLDAVNPATNKIVWRQPTQFEQSDGDGIVTTAGGLLFEGSLNGILAARSVSTGKVLWSWQTGGDITSTPVSYSVGGVQYLAVLTGKVPSSGDSLWALRLGGSLPQAAPPPPLPSRVPVTGPTVAGSATGDVVVLGRTWDSATGAPGGTENLASQVAMAPPIMTVPAGTTVTFENPSGNSHKHCAESFFDPASFTIGPLSPGQSGSFTFTKAGSYFYNDCAGFPWDTGEIVVS
jgi:PQQ-dependent dehydrogenase (methanol/ethanol family)